MQANFEINYGIKSDVGRVRNNNEDYTTFFIPNDAEELKKNGCLFIVADGVGGAAKGEVASHYAADAVLYEYYNTSDLPPAERLKRAIQNANKEIYQHSQENGNFMRMATTMVAALILQNNLIVAHVGDSRLYLLRGGKVKQITRDHSVVAEMVRNGAMTEEEACTSKAKNRLTRSVGGDPEVHVDVSEPIPLGLGDRILICSDGLTRYLDGEGLLVAQKGDVETLAKELVKFANEHGGADNVSVILLEMVQKAKVRLKKPTARNVPPEKLGWDEAETQYPIHQPIQQHKKIPLWAIVTGVAILLIAIVVIFTSWGKETSENEELVKLNSSIGEESSVTPTPTNRLPKAANPALATSPEPGVENTSGKSQPDESYSANDPTQPQEQSGSWECVYEVQSGDSITSILGEFGLTYDETDKYSYYKSCDLDGSKLTCTQKEEYLNNNIIGNDLPEWIVVYSSKDDGEIYFEDTNGEKRIWGREQCQKTKDDHQIGFVIEGGMNDLNN